MRGRECGMRSIVWWVVVVVCFSLSAGARTTGPLPGQGSLPVHFFGRESHNSTDSTISVIVEFKEEPLFLARLSSPFAATGDFYRGRFAQFAADLGGSGARTLAAGTGGEYYRAFFGARITVPISAMQAIERLPYVRTVHHEKEVTTQLFRNPARISVPAARSAHGVSGKGVRIGIIDSGIDYMHPALGGGFGPGSRVTGGYDLVNDDADPMDDHGHGTHVAGIVAANGDSIKGIAPGAVLLAYKVLDARGRGKEGDIIGAIERALDPDGDGDPADRVHILNLSLGSEFGDPDDAASRAVDNAVRLGVTVVVAAGNAGAYAPVQGKEDNYYYTGMETIGSPGTARLALTVGASDAADRLAAFSSKGPNRAGFGIKPDVLAPGDEITSLAPGGGLAVKSGTSMAAPMVAGIAALLLERAPSMNPAEVRSAIMNTALDLGLPAMKQGAGRVDASRTLGTWTSITPHHLSFGLDDPAVGLWSRTETLMVHNRNDIGQEYAVSTTGNRAGITVAVSPPSITIPAGTEAPVFVTLTVNNTVVPIVDEDIRLFDGRVRLAGTEDTLEVPWAFARTSRLIMAFDRPGAQFIGASAVSMITPGTYRYGPRVRWMDPLHVEVAGAFLGTYDLAAHYPDANAVVTQEQFVFTGSGSVSLRSSAALHTIRFDGRDPEGVPFPHTGTTRRSVRVELPGAVSLFVMLPAGEAAVTASPATSRIAYHPVESLVDLRSSMRIVVPQYDAFRGLAGDVTLSHPRDAYRRQTVRLQMPPGIFRSKVYTEVIAVRKDGSNELFNTVQVAIDTVDAQGGVVPVQLAVMAPVDDGFFVAPALYVNAGDIAADRVDYATRYFSVVGDSIVASLPSQVTYATYRSPDGGEMTFGGGPVHIINLTYNNAVGTSLFFDPHFRGGLLEERYTDVMMGSYAIFDGNGAQVAGAPLSAPRSSIPVTPGKYRLAITAGSFQVRNAGGTVTLLNEVDLTRPVVDAPFVTSFLVADGQGRAMNQLVQGDAATLRFSGRIPSDPLMTPVLDSTRAYARLHRTRDWVEVPVTLSAIGLKGFGAVFEASLAGMTVTDRTGVDLRIRLVDAWGNASDMTVAPALAVGEWVDDGGTPVPGDPGHPEVFDLAQNFPNPFNPSTTIRFDLPERAAVRLTLFSVLGQEVRVLAEGLQEAGTHTVRLDGAGLASGVYFYRLEAGSFVRTRSMMLVR